MTLAARLGALLERMARVAGAAGRPAPKLLAVSKGQNAGAIRQLYELGQRDFGESYAQELERKAGELTELRDLRWHFLGHLQRNKVRRVLDHASCLFSLDSLRLAEALDLRLAERRGASPPRLEPDDPRFPVLVEVNVAAEAQKSGCAPAELGALLARVEELPRLRLLGLMGVPPLSATAEEARPWFEALAALREAHGGPARLPELSMGMSHDLDVAIQAGSTWVRVGTALFGPRG